MGALARFEAFIERMVEGPFARLAGGGLQPVEIAKRIEKEMEGRQNVGPGKVYVPNRFTVRLNPADHEQLAPAAPALEREMVAFAVNLAKERGFSFIGKVGVSLAADETVPRRRIKVDGESVATLDSESHLPPLDLPDVERTQAINAARLREAIAGAPAATLVVYRDGEAQVCPVEREVVTIGRALDNDLVVEDSAVSRHHAEIRRQHGRYYLTDLQSTNGTAVNGRRVAGSFLESGDKIRIGEMELEFRLSRQGAA